jgi:hypothetical protein
VKPKTTTKIPAAPPQPWRIHFFQRHAADDPANRHHYRLFCLLERDGGALGHGGPSVLVLAGLDKAFMTTLSENDYAKVSARPRVSGQESEELRATERIAPGELLACSRAGVPSCRSPLRTFRGFRGRPARGLALERHDLQPEPHRREHPEDRRDRRVRASVGENLPDRLRRQAALARERRLGDAAALPQRVQRAHEAVVGVDLGARLAGAQQATVFAANIPGRRITERSSDAFEAASTRRWTVSEGGVD